VGVNNPTLTNVTTGGSISVSNSNSNSGWLAGAGIEWAFAPNWTAKIEYDFLGLNNQSFTVPVGTPSLAAMLSPSPIVTRKRCRLGSITCSIGTNMLD
jgi:opacity protein-like surface antigen